MSTQLELLATGRVDAEGITSSAGWQRSWRELEAEAPGTGSTFRALFGRPDATFRRLDRMTRALLLAVEACALDTHLSAAEREETALVVETVLGSLEVDLHYTRALSTGVVRVALFPYTLQSTCLGDIALRHGLRGPTLSLSIAEGQEGEALREALRLFARGGLRHAVVGTADALGEPVNGVTPTLRASVSLYGA
jgi:3-oxoacyl-(acyl-carrier-protein) synthase